MKKYAEIEDFQFSAGYLSFWDKLERSNGFLERMITLIEEPLESRVVQMFTGWAANGTRGVTSTRIKLKAMLHRWWLGPRECRSHQKVWSSAKGDLSRVIQYQQFVSPDRAAELKGGQPYAEASKSLKR